MTNTINKTPSETVEFKDIPESIKQSLTPEEYQEVIEAQKKAALEQAGNRLAILKTEISAPVQTKIESKGIKLQSLVEEKGIIDTVTDFVEGGAKTVKQAIENFSKDGVEQSTKEALKVVPGAATVLTATEKASDIKTAWERITTDPINFFRDLFAAIGALFKGDYSKIQEIFGFGKNFKDVARSAMENIDQNILDISNAVKARWEEILTETKDLKDITLDKLRKAMSEKDIASTLGIEVDNKKMQEFLNGFFEKDNFAKMTSEVLKATNETKLDEKNMTLETFISHLSKQ